ncbi:MAG TPA: hypothetical protein VMH35_16460 [Streptosporangiaceae bacterium]|nr:hypothetical protein [Streptosporangiaceae bacterium]
MTRSHPGRQQWPGAVTAGLHVAAGASSIDPRRRELQDILVARARAYPAHGPARDVR